MTPVTLAEPFSFELEVKKSLFLAHAASVATPEEALAFFAEKSVGDATHNCWAYKIGSQYRFFDDNEPAGTAGRPIHSAIDGQHCDRVAVLVIRWFGGIKLGAGGLARAYGGSAAECLRRAARVPIVEFTKASLHCPFECIGSVHALLSTHEAAKTGEGYDADGVMLALELPAARFDALAATLRDATRGQVILKRAD